MAGDGIVNEYVIDPGKIIGSTRNGGPGAPMEEGSTTP
jgi:hypothetical protein